MGWDLTEIVETNIQYTEKMYFCIGWDLTEIVETNIQYTE